MTCSVDDPNRPTFRTHASVLALGPPRRVKRVPIPGIMSRIRSVTPDLTTLFERVQHGDQTAFAEVYDAVAPMVFSAVSRVLRDPAMSEEVTQEVFVEVWTHAARFDPEKASVSTWAVTIARRRAIDRVRKEQSQRNRVEQLARNRPTLQRSPTKPRSPRIEGERVDRALADLPPDQREIIELAFIEGLSHSDHRRSARPAARHGEGSSARRIATTQRRTRRCDMNDRLDELIALAALGELTADETAELDALRGVRSRGGRRTRRCARRRSHAAVVRHARATSRAPGVGVGVDRLDRAAPAER